MHDDIGNRPINEFLHEKSVYTGKQNGHFELSFLDKKLFGYKYHTLSKIGPPQMPTEVILRAESLKLVGKIFSRICRHII